MKTLIFALIFICSASFADSSENVGRLINMNQAPGTYSLIRSNADFLGRCPNEIQLRIGSWISRGNIVPTLDVGLIESLRIQNATSTRHQKDGCTTTKVRSYNDSLGWTEERGHVVCENRVIRRWYKKIALDYNLQTVRLLVKNDKRTDLSCIWERAD